MVFIVFDCHLPFVCVKFINGCYFDIIMNQKEAEFIGILLGDGCIRSNFKEVKISLNSETDREYADYIKKLVKRLYDVRIIYQKRKNENTCDLRIINKKFVNLLVTKVCMVPSPKMFRAKIPEKYFKLRFFSSLLRGLFDTDGSLVVTNNNGTIYPRLELKISESPMKYQFIEILEKLGFRFGVYKSNQNQVRIQMNGLGQLKLWMKKVGFSNAKHKQKLRIFNMN